MSLKALFKAVVNELESQGITYAVAGGLAADLYRAEPRLTMDVDLAISVNVSAVDTASTILRAIGLTPGTVRKADLDGGPMFAIKRKSSKPCMIVGRFKNSSSGEGVDLLLPELPWITRAVERAQDHKVDFGFGSVPALTIEDVIISKLYALQSSKIRAKDLDDLQSVFSVDHDFNIPYLAGQIRELKITLPAAAKPFLPGILIDLIREGVRTQKALKNWQE